MQKGRDHQHRASAIVVGNLSITGDLRLRRMMPQAPAEQVLQHRLPSRPLSSDPAVER
jgi:hypothetical protein